MGTSYEVHKIGASLADGRQIVYFDETADAPRVLHDTRDLPPQSSSSEVRFDPVLREWVALASHRQTRTHLPPADECPLCPSVDGRTTEVPSPDYDVVVFENRFPSFSAEAGTTLDTAGPRSELSPRGAGRGRTEVVCFTSDHHSSFSALSVRRVRTVVEAWADRTEALSALPYVEHVFPFENRGEEIGVTLAHPHGQIYGYPFVPPRARQALDSARAHLDRTGRQLFADVIAAEEADGSRVVLSGDLWVAFVPVAARWPMEVHLYPRRQVPDLAALDAAERDQLAEVYLELLQRFDGLYDTPTPYIAAWHQAPVRIDRELGHLHLELFSIRRAVGKLKYLAGSESGMGAFINDVPPEQQAERLRAPGGRARKEG